MLDKRALRRYATALVDLMPTGSEPIAAPLIVDTVRFGASQIVEAARDSREWDAFLEGLSDEDARAFDVFRSNLIQRIESDMREIITDARLDLDTVLFSAAPRPPVTDNRTRGGVS